VNKTIRPDEPKQMPRDRPNNIGIMIRFAVLAAAALVVLAVVFNR
jgi:hypothetical protein